MPLQPPPSSPPPRASTPPPTSRRARPVTEQIRIVRELWLLREQARVQAAERCFLAELQRLLSNRHPPNSRTSYSSPPRPPPQQNQTQQTSTPPVPPPQPNFPHHSLSTLLVDDGPVFESRPRREGTPPARERPEMIYQDMEALRLRQRVTGLSPQFRALLEGHTPPAEFTLVRSRSFGQLAGMRAVSGALESEFRNQLEHLVARRERNPTEALSMPVRMDAEFANGTAIDTVSGRGAGATTGLQSNGALVDIIRTLREEVHVLKNVISASFDLQLEIQRSVRQEVSAAMHTSAQQVAETSMCTELSGGTTTNVASGAEREHDRNWRCRAVAAGACTICLEARIDSLLYACGHMCTCSMCGRQLLAAGNSCPICRAPVRDVVRAFVVTE